MEDKITIKKVDVTPQMANQWLNEHNTHNRPLYERTIDVYALDMKRKFWTLNHQGICFDEEGTLLDGQHRLAAVIRSGKTIPMYVFRGMPKQYSADGNMFDTQMTIDDIKKRSVGDKLSLSLGMENANLKAAMIAVIINICTGKSGRLSPGIVAEVYETYKEEIESVVKNRSQGKGLVVAPALGGFAFAAKPYKEETMKFEIGYFTGVNLAKDSPILVYRNHMQNREAYGTSGAKRSLMSHGLNCLMHYVLGNPLKRVISTNQGIDFFTNKQKKTVNEICELVRL